MKDLTIANLPSMLPSIQPSESSPDKGSTIPFSEWVQRSLADVNRELKVADQAVNDLATGRQKDIHATMIAMQKAEVSFELVLQIRNKLISAYDEIRRMSI